MEKLPDPDERDPEPDEGGPEDEDPEDGEFNPVGADAFDAVPEPVEEPALPAAADADAADFGAADFDAPDDVALEESGLLPEVEVVDLVDDEEAEGDVVLLRALLEPEDVPAPVGLLAPPGLNPDVLVSADALLPDFGTLDEAGLSPGFAPTFSAFRSMVTGRLDVPDEEDVLLLSGLSDEPDPLPPDEEVPPEDLLSVAI